MTTPVPCCTWNIYFASHTKHTLSYNMATCTSWPRHIIYWRHFHRKYSVKVIISKGAIRLQLQPGLYKSCNNRVSREYYSTPHCRQTRVTPRLVYQIPRSAVNIAAYESKVAILLLCSGPWVKWQALYVCRSDISSCYYKNIELQLFYAVMHCT